jgi:hypothetical protein
MKLNDYKMRTTLLERLRPEFIAGFEVNEQEHSEYLIRLRKKLDDKLFYGDLTVSEVKSIFLFGEVDDYDRSALHWKLGTDVFFEEKGVA